LTVYQPAHDFSFNHAHNEYLQIAAEGGVILSAAVAVLIVAGCLAIASALRRDRTPTFWMRAGAASALVAIAVQSLWETGLRMPANAVLCAISFAIAIHRPSGSPAKSSPGS
jgi:O-antigen ligase